jgi:hypothetical protein
MYKGDDRRLSPNCFTVQVMYIKENVLYILQGFGAPVPRTTMGRMSAVIFSAIGIPLHLLLVLNIGMLVAVKLQYLATRWQPGTSFPTALLQCCCQYKGE